MKLNTKKVKGVLNLSQSEKHYSLLRVLPADRLAYFVEQYWIVNWSLQTPYVQENIPHPCVHFVFEKNHSRLMGPVTKKYSYTLDNSGTIFGIKFRPGAFRAFFNFSVSKIRDCSINLVDFLGDGSADLEAEILSKKTAETMVEVAEKFLLSRIPENEDPRVDALNNIINRIEADHSIMKVDDIATQFKINKRTLQRQFSTYVGVSPKWVIRKYRLHEVLEKFETGNIDYSSIIDDLGYFDQAHFIKDFREIIGVSPSRYLNNGSSVDGAGKTNNP